MFSSGGLGGSREKGVLGFRLRIKFIDVWSSALHRPEPQPPAHGPRAHIQEELTLLAPCGKSPLPRLALPPLLPPSCTS